MKKKKKVLVEATHYLTVTLFEMIQRVAPESDLEVEWITHSRRWANWLIRNGVSQKDLHLIKIGRDSAPMVASINGWDSTLPGEPSLLEAIESDRLLRNRRLSYSITALTETANQVGEIARKAEFDFAVGEGGTAVSLAAILSLRDQGIPYLTPTSIRVPVDRFGFFEAPLLIRLIQLAESIRGDSSDTYGSSSDIGAYQDIIAEFNTRRPFRVSTWFSRGLAALQEPTTNPQQFTIGEYLRLRNPLLLSRYRKDSLKALERVAVNRPMGDSIILVPLQIQPESSVDILAWQWRDQLKWIRAVARRFPNSMIWVREHPAGIGLRDPRIYQGIEDIPNALLVSSDLSREYCLERAVAVATPTGTMALEYALEGRSSIVGAQTFFSNLTGVSQLSDITSPDPSELARSSDAEIKAFRSWLRQVSSPGVFDASYPGNTVVSNQANLDNLRSGFVRLLHSLDSGAIPAPFEFRSRSCR